VSETSIEWTDATWNPVRGCTRVSPGCENCYAERQAARFRGPGGAYEGLVRTHANGEPRWTGEIKLLPEQLDQPLRWRRQRRIFVNSMSDLFHEGVPDEFIDRTFAVMALATRHTFQILTKRPDRMLAYMQSRAKSADFWKRAVPNGYALEWEGISLVPFPLPNVWLGVSVENQATADERIPLLLQTPAAVRFLSVEPLLEAVDLNKAGALGLEVLPDGSATDLYADNPVDWVIVGGESGPHARACNVAWIRSIVEQCKAVGCPVFVKQLGADPFVRNKSGGMDRWRVGHGDFYVRDRKGGDPNEWPEDLRVREFPS